VLAARNGGGNSPITRLWVDGNVLGNITVEHGSMTELQVGGSIGTSGTHISVSVRDNIDSLIAGSVYATINTRANGGAGSVRWLETTTGDFVGSLSTSYLSDIGTGLPSGITVVGDLDADVTFHNAVSSPIDVTGDIASTISINEGLYDTVDAGSLSGQIIINAAGSTYAWTGDVTANGVTLSPRGSYTQSAGTFGGGAVGRAPFALHDIDCDPVNGGTLDQTQIPTAIYLDHYGPVQFNGALGKPIIFQYRTLPLPYPPPNPEVWTTICTSCYTVAVNGSDDRELIITPNTGVMTHSREYRVRPEAGRLECAQVSGNPDVADYDYRFAIYLVP
jgi:hypothetical protein